MCPGLNQSLADNESTKLGLCKSGLIPRAGDRAPLLWDPQRRGEHLCRARVLPKAELGKGHEQSTVHTKIGRWRCSGNLTQRTNTNRTGSVGNTPNWAFLDLLVENTESRKEQIKELIFGKQKDAILFLLFYTRKIGLISRDFSIVSILSRSLTLFFNIP